MMLLRIGLTWKYISIDRLASSSEFYELFSLLNTKDDKGTFLNTTLDLVAEIVMFLMFTVF